MDHEVEGAANNCLGKVILGIDLGDSFSRVAVWHNGSIQLVPLDAEGNKEIPSCVAFRVTDGREEVLVGRPALEQLAKGGAIHRVRRVLGQVDIADKSLVSGARFWPFMVQSMGIQGERPVIGIKKGEDWVSIAPEEVVTLILQHLKGMAEKFLGHSVTEAILTGQDPHFPSRLWILQREHCPVIKHDLRIKVQGDLLVPILHRNTTIPIRRELIFTTCTDNQEQAIIQVYEGERAITRHNILLGYIRVGPLPAAPAGVPQIMVQVTVAADDALTVRVRVPHFEGAVKVPDPVIFKMPSASFSQTWCAEALHTKYGTSTDIRLPQGMI